MLREDAVKKRRSAMKEAAMSLRKEAAMNAELRSSASRTGCAGARRKLCLTERSTYTVRERTDPRMQGKETLARQSNVVVRAGSTAMEQTSSRRV